MANDTDNVPPRLTTLYYIEKDGCYLILHRTKKQHDENGDKWIGVGGKFEYGESPEECALREVKEETGLTMLNPRFRGLVTFVSDEWGVEYMHLFTCTEFSGALTDCDEGELVCCPRPNCSRRRCGKGIDSSSRPLTSETTSSPSSSATKVKTSLNPNSADPPVAITPAVAVRAAFSPTS